MAFIFVTKMSCHERERDAIAVVSRARPFTDQKRVWLARLQYRRLLFDMFGTRQYASGNDLIASIVFVHPHNSEVTL